MPRPPTPVPFIATGNPAVDRLQRFVAQALPGKQDGWTKPTLLNSWVNYGAPNLGAGYMKDAQGFVRLRGTIKSGTIGLPAFTLPAGYRPSAYALYAVPSNSAFAEIDIAPGGTVTPSVGSSVWIALDGITFDTR